jgi:hypothetical protein
MNITKMLSELRAEHATISEAIMVLERIARSGPRRRGRPPAWMTGAGPPSREGSKTYTHTPEMRARMAAAQRKRRAAEKKAEAG